MRVCPFDGYRVHEIGDNLFKCFLCDMRLTDKKGVLVPYKNVIYPYDGVVRDRLKVGDRVPEPVVQEPEPVPDVPFGDGLDPDMSVFVRKVAEALTPVEGYEDDEAFKQRAFKVRETFIQELTDCFTGKEDFNKWFDTTKTNLGKHPTEMARIMYNALEGLRSPEAIQFQAGFAAALKTSPF